MRKLTIIAATAVSLAGCGAPGAHPVPPPPSPRPAPSAAAEPNAGSGDRGLDGFVAAVQKRMPAVAADRRDEELEAVAEQSCALLAAGTDAKTIAAVARTLGTADPQATDRATAYRLVRLSIAEVCPAQKARAAEF
jgi:predicted small lipoprotein YifL